MNYLKVAEVTVTSCVRALVVVHGGRVNADTDWENRAIKPLVFRTLKLKESKVSYLQLMNVYVSA